MYLGTKYTRYSNMWRIEKQALAGGFHYLKTGFKRASNCRWTTSLLLCQRAFTASPVVGELQGEPGVVRGLDGDDVGAEVWPQKQAQGLDGVGLLGLASRQTQLGELLVWHQHDHVRAKHDASLLLLVVVDLNSCIVRHAVRDDFGLVSLGSADVAWS